VPQLVVVTGPIASGKSTVAAALGDRLRRAGRPVAVLDLDDVVDTIGGFVGLSPVQFEQAQLVFGRLVAAWLDQGFDVIAHGPFLSPEEDDALLHAQGDGVVPRRVLIQATYDVALERVSDGPGRIQSRDPVFLRATYDRYEQLRPGLPAAEWVFDTTTTALPVIVEQLVEALTSER
jgi:thymidylate kinase